MSHVSIATAPHGDLLQLQSPPGRVAHWLRRGPLAYVLAEALDGNELHLHVLSRPFSTLDLRDLLGFASFLQLFHSF